MKRRLLSMLIVLCLVLGIVPAVSAVSLDNGLCYKVHDDHVEITYYEGSAPEVVIPSEIDGLPVTTIGNRAFDGCFHLTSITIPSSVTVLEEYAFSRCTSLNSISLPNSLTSIGNYAFCRCTSLNSISLPNSVLSIGQGAFSACSSLKSITIPEQLTVISDFAFSECPNLSSVSIPENVVSIGYAAFYGSNLTSISIPEGVTTIMERAFMSSPNLETIYIPKSMTSIHNLAFSFCPSLTNIFFLGNAPGMMDLIFNEVTATAYYPANDPTWTEEIMQNCGGTITWVPYTPSPFTDVPAGSFYADPVAWAVERGITTGASENSFNPDGKCLRAQVVTFLHRAKENPEPASTRNPFSDVKSSDFFYKPVLWAVEKGITNGVSGTKFGSYDVCNRAAVVTFLWRAAGSPEPESTSHPFTDVKPGDFFYKPVLWAVEKGITNGVDATHFGPTTDCNRAQVVTFLYRAYN